MSFLPKEEKQQVITEIEIEVSETLSEIQSIRVDDNTAQEHLRKKQKGEYKLLELIDDVINPVEERLSTATNVERAKSEVLKYIDDEPAKENLLLWWKVNAHRYPIISCIARKYLAIPATSVPSERAFSSTGHIVNRKRSCLLPDTVQMLVFLAENLD